MYILNETASEAFACVLCCAPLTALTVHSEGKSDFRLGIVGATLCHTGSAFGRGGGLFAERRRSVKQGLMEGRARREEEAESSFQPF